MDIWHHLKNDTVRIYSVFVLQKYLTNSLFYIVKLLKMEYNVLNKEVGRWAHITRSGENKLNY